MGQPPADLSAHLMRLGSSSLLILSFPVHENDVLARLTAAERDVAILVASGETNLAIARRRGVSKNTIAKQVAAILRKTNFTSRFEIIALLSEAVLRFLSPLSTAAEYKESQICIRQPDGTIVEERKVPTRKLT